MDDKLIKFDNSIEMYRKLADKHLSNEDYDGALSLLFSALKKEPKNYMILGDIADVYTDMGLYDLSNKYWFIYLDRAPKDKRSIAYEELAINFFYMENLLVSSYYFNLKVNEDGYISHEKIGEEMSEFFFNKIDKRDFYHIAYPFEEADYSSKHKLAKKALATANFKLAKKLYKDIPTECRTEEIDGEYAIVNLMLDDIDGVIKVAKDSLKKNRDNVTAYCNLCSAYKEKGDLEKSHYYYKKALKSRKNTQNEVYQLATCAIDLGDDKIANECLKEVLKDRPKDTVMRLFYAISFINLLKYDRAEEELKMIIKTDPTDKVCKFYLDYVGKIIAYGNDRDNLLPLEYKKGFPEKIERRYKREIKKLIDAPNDLFTKKKGQEDLMELLFWGVKYGGEKIGKKCVYLITLLGTSKVLDRLKDCLIDPDVQNETKGGTIYALILNGYRQKIGIVANNIYMNLKPKKLIAEGKQEEGRFVPAYAMAVAKMIFSGVLDFDKLGSIADQLYKEKLEEIIKNDLTIEELSALIVISSSYKQVKNNSDIYAIYGIEKDRESIIESMIIGDTSNEDN